MPESMGEYKYRPLRPEQNEIRLLRLMPAPPRGEVEIEIFSADATSNPEYEALSYVWGASDLTHEVCIRPNRDDDLPLERRFENLSHRRTRVPRPKLQVLPITRNLGIALSYLTLPDRPRTLWIDAICINQLDEEEKSREVRRMGNIYGEARRVVVWLGEGREDSSLAVTTLKSIGASIDLSNINGELRWRVKVGGEAFHLESELSNPRIARAKILTWIAIRSLFNTPWFTRLWVFQEIGCGSDAIFVVGSEYIHWDGLLGAFLWIMEESKRSLSRIPMLPILDENTLQVACPIFEHFGLFKSLGKKSSFTHLINWTKRSRCLDPRDRIYGILSLLDHSDAAEIVPNYQSSVEQVYTEAILGHIRSTKTLRTFDICDFTKADSALDSALALPSWVPDLSVPNPKELITGWAAAGYSASESQYNEKNGTLHIRGRHVCEINYVATPIPGSASLPEILAICHAWEPVRAKSTGYISGGSLLDAFVSTLFLGSILNLAAFRDSTEPFSIATMNTVYDSLVVEGIVSVDHLLYGDTLRTILPGRTFFTTKEGYIGLCTASARPGDRICIALGGSNPVMLRPVPKSEGHYQVGGGCYVHGLMKGEGILGPLPPRWTDSWVILQNKFAFVFIDPNQVPTQFDPRAGPLQRGWKVYYGLEQHRREISYEGKLGVQRFENEATGEVTVFDPRLTSRNLRRMGIYLQDIILV
jgi:hypothetical protein